MPNGMSNFYSIFFVLGIWVVAAYAWQRFNEPSFPDEETLPHTVDPLRYLFLKSAYRKARFTYVAALLLLYCALVWPGQTISAALDDFGVKGFPVQTWALMVALLLVGLLPNSNVKWLMMLEEQLRRWVHAWFLVPDGIKRTIGVLEDADYKPSPSVLQSVHKDIRDGPACPIDTLRYRWARAAMLIASLNQMGPGGRIPLKKANFDPFEKDYETIGERFAALKPQVAACLADGADGRNADGEQNLTRSVDKLLRRIYAYISWGVRQQADREEAIEQTLAQLGFIVPDVGTRRVFDVIVPATLFVALISMSYGIIIDVVGDAIAAKASGLTLSDHIVFELSSAVAASCMYGFAIFIALNRRAAQIEQSVWQQSSPRCFVSIAISAGLATWAVITMATVIWTPGDVSSSMRAMTHMVTSLVTGTAGEPFTMTPSRFLPIRILTAAPWLLAGAIVSVLLARRLGGDVRRTKLVDRLLDAAVLGGGLAAAAATAQVLQVSLVHSVDRTGAAFGLAAVLQLAGPAALTGFALGAVIGFIVPHAFRTNVMAPPDAGMTHALKDLLRQAAAVLGSKAAAEDWVFRPRSELGGHYSGRGDAIQEPRQRRDAPPGARSNA